MSAFGRVSYSENENTAVESVIQETDNLSAVDKQVEKFDTSYSTDKLQQLYAEYDKITIDEEKVKNLTQIKTNAVTKAVPFRLVLGITTTAVVAVLLLFLCVYNIFVINGMNNSISYLQEEVISYEQELIVTEGFYNDLTNPTNIKNDIITELGYSGVTSNIETVSLPEKVEVVELQGETNWFDGLCNFLSQIFG